MSINIRGHYLSASKSFWQGTHRITSPEQTLTTIQPYLQTCGVTRLSNITHLDRLGFPVTQAIRPNSATLTTSGGKGLTLASALTSAAMEAIEFYCAETFTEVVRVAPFQLPYQDLIQQYPVIPLADLPISQHSLFHINNPELWCLGWDLQNGQEVAVPWEAVILDYRLRQGNWSHLLSFEMSSNGLASGNHVLEAIASGLYELVERDATTCATTAQIRIGYRKPKVKLDTITSPLVQDLLTKFQIAGLTVLLFDCTIDTAIPVYEAYCYAPTHEPISTGHGYGAHLDPEIAMLRALTEAAQTRAAAIAGTRDDFFPAYYSSFWHRDASREINWIESYPPTVDASHLPSEATDTFEEDIALILSKLKCAGRQQAIVVDLTPPDWEISVVRVIVPGLEGHRPHDYRPKHRAAAFIHAKHQEQQALKT